MIRARHWKTGTVTVVYKVALLIVLVSIAVLAGLTAYYAAQILKAVR